MKQLQLILFLLTISYASNGQLAKDGNYTLSGTDVIVNSYTFLTSDAVNGDNSIVVDDNQMIGGYFAGALSQGDLLMIIQMQGVTANVGLFSVEDWGGDYTWPNDPAWGSVTNYNNCGNYEFVEVDGVSGANTIDLSCGLQYSYSDTGKVQIVRVPRWDTLNIPAGNSMVAQNWDGQIGGILAVEAMNQMQLDGVMSASERGFRGGYVNVFKDAGYGGGHYASYTPMAGSVKGEGVWGDFDYYLDNYSLYCRGSAANAGGGGNSHNAGGGGGANAGTGTYNGMGNPDVSNANYVTAWDLESAGFSANTSSGGGRGGYSSSESNNDPLIVPPGDGSWNFDNRRQAGGLGGEPLDYSTGKIFMGGGGGAGDYNDQQAGAGGRGGGIVIIRSFGAFSGNGSITSNGQNGFDSQASNPGLFGITGVDGAGGAGAGGTVIIQNEDDVPAGITIDANGGTGGNNFMQNGSFGPAIVEAYGPGGGGGGGYISIVSGTPTTSVNGGVSGLTNSGAMSDFPMNGATDGADGLSNTNMDFLTLDPVHDTLCNPGTANLSVIVNGTLPPGTVIEWHDQPVGGNLVNTGINFTTPFLSVNTTYYVGICPGSHKIPVTALISNPIVIDASSVSVTGESCLGNDGSITGINVSGGFGNLIYDWNGSVSASPDTTNLTAGNYTLTVTDENGCTETEGPFTVSSAGGPVVDNANLDVQDELCGGVNGSITGLQITGNSPFSYEWNGISSTSQDTTGLGAGSYSLLITDDLGCTTTAGPFTINNNNTLVVDTTNFVISPTACDNNTGSVTGIVANGANPLSVEWNGVSQGTTDLTNAAAGSYNLTITDDNGCEHNSGPYVITTFADPVIDTTNISISVSACDDPTGGITGINVTGNNPFTYEWNGQSGNLNLSIVSSGSYNLTVTDVNGCTASEGPFFIGELDGPDVSTVNLSITDENCGQEDGAINGITINSGNSPYQFEWNGNSYPNQILSDTSAGSYTLDVIDAGGCITTVGPFEIEENEGPVIDTSSMIVLDELCDQENGQITGIDFSGGISPYNYGWLGESPQTNDILNLTGNTYTYFVTDDGGCSDSIDVNINNVGGIEAVFSWTPELPAVEEEIILSHPFDVFNLSSFYWVYSGEVLDGNTVSFDDPGTYEITFYVTDSDGCSDTLTKTISISGDLIIPNVITPNGDQENDYFVLKGLYDANNTSVTIFDRWGKMIYENASYNNQWNGQNIEGKEISDGVYFYMIEDPKGNTYQGQVTVIR